MKKLTCLLAGAVILTLGASSSQAVTGVYSNWNYRAKLSVTNNSSVTDFSMLIVISTNNITNGFQYAQFNSPSGGDLRFADSTETTELNYEISQWNTNGNSCAWVRVPTITNGTSYIYMYWGGDTNPPPCTTNGSTWNSAYAGVWHLGADNRDSTTNANHGSNVGGATTVAGPLGDVRHFSGASQYIDCGTNDSLMPVGATIWMWVKTDAAPAVGDALGGRSTADTSYTNGYGLYFTTATVFRFFKDISIANGWGNSPAFTPTQWNQIGGNCDPGQRVRTYVNGVRYNGNQNVLPGAITPSTNSFRIGNLGGKGFTGSIADFQVFNSFLGGAVTIAMEANQAQGYLSQNFGFPLYGVPEARGGAPAVTALPASSIDSNSATLNGQLTSAGGAENPYVYICWDYADQGTNSLGAWAHPDLLGTNWGAGQSFFTNLTGLILGSNYTYRCFVSNSAGAAWSDPIQSFTPGAPSLPGFYVSPGGTAVGGTNWATAFTNLQAAIDTATNGASIFVKTGQYVSAATTILSNKVLTIRGGYAGTTPEPGPCTNNALLTVLSGNNAIQVLRVVNCPTGGVVSELTISGGKAAPGGGLYLSATTNVFTNCIFSDCQSGLGYNGFGVYLNSGYATFDTCVIRDNRSSVGYGAGGAGLYLNAGILNLRSCVISGNTSFGKGSGVYMLNGIARLFNCLVRDNTSLSSPNASIYVDGGTGVVESCTIIGNSPIGIKRAGGTAIVTNSIVWNNGDDIDGTVTLAYSDIGSGDNRGTNGCIATDPQFVKGYYLGDGSLCINAGGDSAVNAGLSGRYAQAGVTDSGMVDLGYHYDAAFSATDVYVATNGNNAWPGTQAQPFKTITYALAIAPANTRIHVAAGAYKTNNLEVFPLTLATDGVQLLGTNAAATIIDSSNSGKQVMVVKGVGQGSMVSNLTIRGAGSGGNIPYSGDGANGAGLWLRGTSVRILDSIIRDNALYGGFGAGVYVEGGSPVIQGCLIRNNLGNGTYNNPGGGLYHASGALTLRSCIITTNVTAGGGKGAGIYCASLGGLNAFNCLIASNKAGAGYTDGIYAISNAPVSIANCTLADNGGIGVNGASGASVGATNSILWNNGMDVTGTVNLAYCDIQVVAGTNVTTNACISADPKFTNGYYLALDSLCVDRGSGTAKSNGVNLLTTRIDGKTDTDTVDLGYHYPTLQAPVPTGSVIILY